MEKEVSVRTSFDTIHGSLREKCGIIGLVNVPELIECTAHGLSAIQHRGQDGFGIIAYSGRKGLAAIRQLGLVQALSENAKAYLSLGAPITAIGHLRYATTGSPTLESNLQPFAASTRYGPIAIAHNGNITNFAELADALAGTYTYTSTSDSEILLACLRASEEEYFEDALVAAIKQLRGAFSLVILKDETMYAIRDTNGIRPLWYGSLGTGFAVASETVALKRLGAVAIREVGRGQIMVLSGRGIRSFNYSSPADAQFCSFELIYFMDRASLFSRKPVSEFRFATGESLAVNSPVDADVVIPVPNSGIDAALGYSHKIQLPIRSAITVDLSVGRSFINPEVSRNLIVERKYKIEEADVSGQRVVLVDDSLVRGNTLLQIIPRLRQLGAAEVHVRIASPPVTHPCFLGVNIGSESELFVHQAATGDPAARLDCDSIEYLSLEHFRELLDPNRTDIRFCLGCLTGTYPNGTLQGGRPS